MKERKNFIDKVKQVYEKHTNAIQATVLVVIAIALFIAGYLVSWNFLRKPLNDNQFELCEQVARDVYAQKGTVIVEAPEDFSVEMTTTTITVKYANRLCRGKVIAKLQNGELVMTRNMEIGDAVFVSILMGILFVLVPALVIAIIGSIYEKLNKKK